MHFFQFLGVSQYTKDVLAQWFFAFCTCTLLSNKTTRFIPNTLKGAQLLKIQT